MYVHDGLIYVVDMPGAEAPLARWFSELDDAGIDTVFCLATDEELRQKSPDYAAWLENGDGESQHIRLSDVSLPADLQSDELAPHRFWEHAFLAAYLVSEGKPIFVHAVDGDGRAEMFCAGILIVQGHDPDDAIERIGVSGSKLKAEQIAFIRAGIPRPIMETMPPEPEPDPEPDDGRIDIFSPEEQERILKESENPNSSSNRSLYGPNDEYRDLWEKRCSITNSDPALQQHGLRTILDPMSDAWLQTTHDEKVRAFRAAVSVVLNDRIESPSVFQWSGAIEIRLLQDLEHVIPVSRDAFVIAGTCFVQAGLDLDYSIPSTKEETDSLLSAFEELKDGRKVRSAEGKFERRGLGKLPLGREELDSYSHEGQQLSIQEKVNNVKKVIEANQSLLDAVLVYRYRYRGREKQHVLRSLPKDLFTIAAYVLTSEHATAS